MAAVSPAPAFRDDTPGAWRCSPGFSGHQETQSQRATGAAAWSSASSPDFQRECNQVYETLGSLQKALSLNGNSYTNSRIHDEAHRQETDSLWRENRELRSEVRVWQDEAKTLQRENAELQLQVAQLRAELDAERALRAAAPAPAVALPPPAPAATPSREAAISGSPFASSLTCSFGAALDASETAVAAAATPSRRRSGSRCGATGSYLSGIEEAELSTRHADELVALSSRHAGEVAELHVRHARSLEMLQEEADVASTTACAAERRCRRAERSALRAEAASARLSLEAARLIAELTFFAAWRHATSQAVLSATSKHARVLAAGEAFRIGQHELSKVYCWLIWISTLREAADKRGLRAFEVELLRSRFSRHAQLSWLSAHWATREAMLIVQDALLCWRTHVAVLVRVALGGKLYAVQLRYGRTRKALDRLSVLTYVQRLVREVAAAWHCEARAARVAHLTHAATQAAVARMGHLERQAAGLRNRLATAREGSLKQKAWLAIWLTVYNRARDAQAEAFMVQSAQAQEAQALAERLDSCTKRALAGALRDQLHVSLRQAWEAWHGLVVEARWGNTVEALEARLVAMRRRGRMLLLSVVAWGRCKVLLYRALGGWMRLLHRGPGALGGSPTVGGRLELERELRAQRERATSQRKALLLTMSNLLLAKQAYDLIFCTWSSWQQVLHEAKQLKIANTLSLQEAAQRQRMDQAHVLVVCAASRVQAGFVVRACWAIWRRLRPVQRLLSGGEELAKLRAAYAHLNFARTSQVNHLGELLEQQHMASVAYAAWLAWRRRRREGALLAELENLQQLLSRFHIECQKQQEFVLVDAWMETQSSTHAEGQAVAPIDSRSLLPAADGTAEAVGVEPSAQQARSARDEQPAIIDMRRVEDSRPPPRTVVQSSNSLPHLRPQPNEPLRPAAWPSVGPRGPSCRSDPELALRM